MLDVGALRGGDELPADEFDGMSDAAVEQRLATIEWALSEDTPETVETFLVSPAGQQGGPERVARLRSVFDDVRDWRHGRRHDCLAELARRRAMASDQAKEKASARLFFGPWRGFDPLDHVW